MTVSSREMSAFCKRYHKSARPSHYRMVEEAYSDLGSGAGLMGALLTFWFGGLWFRRCRAYCWLRIGQANALAHRQADGGVEALHSRNGIEVREQG